MRYLEINAKPSTQSFKTAVRV